MIYLLGGSGRLGRAITASRPTGKVESLDRSVYEDWWQSDATDRIARHFENVAPGSTILIAAGLLDPALPPAQHERVNVQLPIRVMEAAGRLGIGVVTFGTVMERLSVHPNAYVASKAALADVVAERAAAGSKALHLQIHTLYGGGLPAPFMFLGQMYEAIRTGHQFRMSPGLQLREYHHVDDDAAAIHAVMQAEAQGVLALSHGEPSTLRDLATHVFEDLGKLELLEVGAVPGPSDDNYATVLPRLGVLQPLTFRPAGPGVAAYLRALLSPNFPHA
jgi:nucleoside-diphosphate-sugar epimerase